MPDNMAHCTLMKKHKVKIGILISVLSIIAVLEIFDLHPSIWIGDTVITWSGFKHMGILFTGKKGTAFVGAFNADNGIAYKSFNLHAFGPVAVRRYEQPVGKQGTEAGFGGSIFGSRKKDIDQLWPDSVVDKSQMILFVSVLTNDPTNEQLKVLEIWKGAKEAAASGITNGLELPTDMHFSQIEAGVNAIVFLPKQDYPHSGARYHVWSVTFVRGGRFVLAPGNSVTIQEFKARYGF